MRFIVVFALTLCPFAAVAFTEEKTEAAMPTWQDVIAEGVIPYHQLTVDDFRIDDASSSKDAFHIRGSIDPRYHFITKLANGFQYAYIDRWMIFSGLDTKETYRRSSFKEMQEWLPYAQAILDLNEICARRAAALQPGQLPSARGVGFKEVEAELTQRVINFMRARYKEVEAEVETFVKATANGSKKKKVRELAAEIRKRLDAMPATTVPAPHPQASPSASPVRP